MRAGNYIGAAGAASLAPSLERMTQLTSLHLSGTRLDIRGSSRCERVLATAGNALMMLCLWAGAVVRGAVAGGGACEGRAEWRRMPAGTFFGAAGAASLAPSLERMAQLTSLNLNGTLHASGAACAVSGCLRTPAMC
jgi:hypothetical protein